MATTTAAPAPGGLTLTGTSGNDSLNGGKGNDAIFGLGGNDSLFGNAGSDSIEGGDGNDLVDGGNGDDLLWGHGGNDTVRGGGGNDLLHYQYEPGAVTQDVYDGGSNIDTLRLVLRASDYTEDLRAQVAAFEAFVAARVSSRTGELSSSSRQPNDFTFLFANGSTLRLTTIERIEVVLLNEPPVMGAAATGGVTEAGSPVAGDRLTKSGTLSFTDADAGDIHLVAASSAVGNLGIMTGAVTTPPGSNSPGTVTWTYSVSALAVEYLRAGETRTETFTVTVIDSAEASSAQTVTITITGADDGATITGTTTGTVYEDGGSDATVSASLAVSDPDHDQSAFAPPAAAALAGTYGSFSFDATTGAWSYTVDSSRPAVQALGMLETASDTLTVQSLDGSDSETLHVTIQGRNDDVMLAAGAQVDGEVTEALGLPAAGTTLSTSGSIGFMDADATDTHFAGIVTQSPASAGIDITQESTNGQVGTADWTWSIAASYIEGLGLGHNETGRLPIAYVIADNGAGWNGSGWIWIFGTNDAVDIDTANSVVTGSIDEPADAYSATTAPVTVTGYIDFTDRDVRDRHTVSIETAPLLGAAQAQLASDSSSTVTGALVPGRVTWSYTLSGAQLEALAGGAPVTDTFRVLIDDDQGGATGQTVSITLQGSNDAPMVSGPVLGTATEGGLPSALNPLANASDPDSGTTLVVAYYDALPQGVSWNPVTQRFVLAAKNSAFDSIAAGATRDVTVTYAVGDGSLANETSMTWTVTGTNDAPVLATDNTLSGEVVEAGRWSDAEAAGIAGVPTATGTLSASDIDEGDTLTWSFPDSTIESMGNPTIDGSYGTLSLQADGSNATWTYMVDQARADSLEAGSRVTETFTVRVQDGAGGSATQQITVDVHGAPDLPSEDSVLAAGALALSEVWDPYDRYGFLLDASGAVFTDGNQSSIDPPTINPALTVWQASTDAGQTWYEVPDGAGGTFLSAFQVAWGLDILVRAQFAVEDGWGEVTWFTSPTASLSPYLGTPPVLGGLGDDLLHSRASQAGLFGGPGHDTVVGDQDTARAGALEPPPRQDLFGGLGHDLLLAASGAVGYLSPGSGNDLGLGAGGADRFDSTSDHAILFGRGSDDEFVGQAIDDPTTADTVEVSHNLFNGGAGNDSVWSDTGHDTLMFTTELGSLANQAGIDTFSQFQPGEDRLMLDLRIFAEVGSAGGAPVLVDKYAAQDNASFGQIVQHRNLNLDSPDTVVLHLAYMAPNTVWEDAVEFARIYFADGSDEALLIETDFVLFDSTSSTGLDAGTGHLLFLGTDSRNTIAGSTGADLMVADTALGTGMRFFGEGGDDVLVGGSGEDMLDGGAGRNRLVGGEGADAFVFSVGKTSAMRDAILDFQARADGVTDADTIWLSSSVFTGLATVSTPQGTQLASTAFGSTLDADEADGGGQDRIVVTAGPNGIHHVYYDPLGLDDAVLIVDVITIGTAAPTALDFYLFT